MMWTGPHTDPAKAKGLLIALLALAVVAAVSPVFVMPGCTMSTKPFDFGCEHGYISQHITELPAAAMGIVFAAVVAIAVLFALGISAPPSREIAVVEDPSIDDPLGERLRV